jgi:hypothetical protein
MAGGHVDRALRGDGALGTNEGRPGIARLQPLLAPLRIVRRTAASLSRRSVTDSRRASSPPATRTSEPTSARNPPARRGASWTTGGELMSCVITSTAATRPMIGTNRACSGQRSPNSAPTPAEKARTAPAARTRSRASKAVQASVPGSYHSMNRLAKSSAPPSVTTTAARMAGARARHRAPRCPRPPRAGAGRRAVHRNGAGREPQGARPLRPARARPHREPRTRNRGVRGRAGDRSPAS